MGQNCCLFMLSERMCSHICQSICLFILFNPFFSLSICLFNHITLSVCLSLSLCQSLSVSVSVLIFILIAIQTHTDTHTDRQTDRHTHTHTRSRARTHTHAHTHRNTRDKYVLDLRKWFETAWDKYLLELRNRFETLQEKTEKSTPNDEYENFVNAHLEAAAKYIPTKLKTKYRVPWETLAVREKRALVKTASKNYRKNLTNTNALKLKTAQYQLAGIYIKEQTEYIQNQRDKIRDSVEDRQSRIAWQTINEVSRRKNTAKAKLKAANQQERIKLWKQHFENLLGNPPKITHEPITRIISKQLDIKLGPFTQEKLDSVLRKIKNRKAAGLDEIPPEVWKTRQFNDILLRHCNAV